MRPIIGVVLILLVVWSGCGGEESDLDDAPEPDKPTGLQPELLPEGIKLTWLPSNFAKMYWIFRQPSTSPKQRIGSLETNEFIDTNVVQNTEYTYWVQAVGPVPGEEDALGFVSPPSEKIAVRFVPPVCRITFNGVPVDKSLALCPGEAVELELHNIVRDAFQWEITGEASWLEVTPRNGQLAGNAHTTVRLLATESDTTPKEESVDLRIRCGTAQELILVVTRGALNPKIEISPSLVNLTPENRWTEEVTLENVGDCALTWEATPSVPWLTVKPRTGRLERGASQRVTVCANVDGLDAGNYQARIPFTSGQTLLGEVNVNVRVTGILSGQFLDCFTRQGIPGVEVTISGIGATVTEFTDSGGQFQIPYQRDDRFSWVAEHETYLTARGSVTTDNGRGRIEETLIPIPAAGGTVAPDINGFDVPWCVVLSDDERRAFVTNRDGGHVSVIDTRSNGVIDSIKLDKPLLGVDYVDGQLFVASPENTVFFIDPLQPERFTSMELRGGPAYLAACGDTLAVTLQDAIAGNQVAFIDIQTRRVNCRIPTGANPFGIVWDSFCQWVFVANNDAQSLSRIEPCGASLPLLQVGPKPQGVAATSRYVYTADFGQITRVNIQTGQTTEFFLEGHRFAWVTAIELPDDKGDLVYATDETLGVNQVVMWHPASNESATIPVGQRPFGIAATRDGRAYVCNADDNTVQVLESR